ncbi:putative E3 ubiquitin-protein ligase LIN-1 [Platanthera guangdongensis]|uniref:RING-type E3 ubiquitin transferase n=1 Tax=Platanthera guangdongensis TaxID=2320717 RepID=A0ABR2MP06_9ASPA
MATLEELLADDGFIRERHKLKRWPTGGTARLSASSSASRRFGNTDSGIRPVRTRSCVLPRKSLSSLQEKNVSLIPRSGNAAARRLRSVHYYDEQSLKSRESDDRVFSSVKGGSMKFEGKSQWRFGSVEDPDVNEKSQILQVKPNSIEDVDDESPVPAMDEDSLKAMFSMINSCVSQLIEDESFRLSLHQSCASSLKSSLVRDMPPRVNGAMYTLKEAIGSVERIITEGPNPTELKRSSFKLSVITCLKSVEADNGQTCGIPNSHLAACGHLYLSIIYKIQKKDKVSAKHLLQVFCDSPYQARTELLPGLWEILFLPSLAHLKAWYDKEVESVPVNRQMKEKLEFLEKIYNDLLDMGTSQVAAYSKGWLMEEKSISFPSIPIPFTPVHVPAEDANEVVSFESFSSSNSVRSKTMISRRLYESVFSNVKRNEISHEIDSAEEEVEEEAADETKEEKAGFRGRKNRDSMQKDNERQSNTAEELSEYYGTRSQDSATSSEENNKTKENYGCSSSSGITETEEIKLKSEVQFSPDVKGYFCVGKCDMQEHENGLKLKKLAQLAFQLTEEAREKRLTDESIMTNGLDGSCSVKKESRDILLRGHEESDHSSLFSRIPKEFICPLTGRLLMDPVTLDSGYTFELAAIQDRFNHGNKTCPITGEFLKCSTIPDMNMPLKHMIVQWMEKCFKNFTSLATQSTFIPSKQASKSNYELPLLIVKQTRKESIEHLISLGGMKFLTHMLEFGSLEEKLHAAEVLVQCIQADGCCRNQLAMNISKSSLVELMHSKQVHARTSATSLLIELICLNRRMDITVFVNGLKTRDIGNIKHDLFLCLDSSLPEDKALVAVLLLHLDYMEESRTSRAYKDAAVKCIKQSLESCMSDKKFIANCRRALLMLGGHFSYSGEIVTENWLLEKAGYDCKDEDDWTISEEEEKNREDWLRNMALILLQYGNKSFQRTLSKCWKSGNPDLVSMCVTTTAWLSLALSSHYVPTIQVSAFSSLAPRLEECLKSDQDIKHRVLASFSLLNFSKILECRLPLISISDQIHDPLKTLQAVTWTAKHLYNDIFGANL